ncbi:hypothetical protein EVAR_77509_1 [Eumeta japonica]|uniref:Uncharacterized protein n=1 Tax=Eumeta variegata TaxID=151549 RepID=A0A4C1T7A7_EUMVA|nr:hypothetical protein EVAR_77509_1 [Eumeta japonica]
MEQASILTKIRDRALTERTAPPADRRRGRDGSALGRDRAAAGPQLRPRTFTNAYTHHSPALASGFPFASLVNLVPALALFISSDSELPFDRKRSVLFFILLSLDIGSSGFLNEVADDDNGSGCTPPTSGGAVTSRRPEAAPARHPLTTPLPPLSCIVYEICER